MICSVYVYMYVFMYVCIYVCMYVCMYMYVGEVKLQSSLAAHVCS